MEIHCMSRNNAIYLKKNARLRTLLNSPNDTNASQHCYLTLLFTLKQSENLHENYLNNESEMTNFFKRNEVV